MMDVPPVLKRLSGGSSKIDVLTVGDLESVQRTLTTTDSGQHFDVISVSTTREIRKYLRGLHPEVVLIDATLPGGAGLELCRHVRRQSPEVVIMLLSAAVRESRIVRGFEAGADDYLTRPFGDRELICRIAAKLRRASRANRFEGIQTGSLRMDTRNLKAYLGGRPVALRPKEFELLATLASSDGRLKLRKELITEVWGGEVVDRRTLGAHLSRVRTALARHSDHEYIECVRGLGYRFHPDVARSSGTGAVAPGWLESRAS